MSPFPKESAFEQADERRARDQARLDNFPADPPKPKQVTAETEGFGISEIQDLYYDLGVALQHLESGDVTNALQLVEEARSSLYRWLR